MRNIKGASIAQYAIILALLGLTIAVSFFFLGDNIKNQFKFLSFLYDNNNKVIADNLLGMQISKGAIPPGGLGGSFENPVMECSGDTCAFDMGPFVLNSIPENFAEFVETSGTSGGTDKIASFFDQIAEYFDEINNDEGYEDFKNLANLGHFLSDIHEAIENTARSCQSFPAGSRDSTTCFDRAIRDRTDSLTLPAELAELLPNYRDYDLYRLIRDGMYIGEATYDFKDYDSDVYPSYAMVEVFKGIMDNPNYPDELKAITQELYLDIADLGFQQSSLAQCVKEGIGDGKSFDEYDPITGDRIGRVDFVIQEGLEDLLKPNASSFTDLESALICVTGGNSETSNKCHDKFKTK
ncbi:MAG: hypothetical protein AB1782_18750 [Cyanobacteriota bacterium]